MVNWETTTIGELLEFKNGLNKGKEFFGKGTPIVNYMDVYKHRGIYAKQLRGRVTLSTEEIRRFDVQKGDVFFTRTSETPEEVGYAGVMLDEIDDCVFSGFVLRGRPKTDKLDISYCQYAFMTEEIRKVIMSGCTYTTRALTNGRQLSAIEILLPSKNEQRRIAEALSDTDALLASMEKLIAKKRAIKQGAMQELLTGKRRLPGFEGEWEEKKLENLVISAKSGGTPLTSVAGYYDGYVPFLSINDMTVQGKYLRYTSNRISQEGLDNSASWIVPVGSLIYSMYASVGFVSIAKIPLAISQAVLCLEVNNDNDTEFLYYLLSFIQPNVFKYVGEGTQKNLNAKAVRDFELFMPPTVAEQTAIAEILSDMDAEIDTLTAKLHKLRNIKQGMMSELLTGRIRLAESEPAKATVEVYQEQKAEPTRPIAKETKRKGHNRKFDDAVMIAGIVDALYSDERWLGRKKVQKCLYLLRRYQGESTAAFKRKAAGPYADEVRYKGGEPIAKKNNYITTTTVNQGAIFARGKNIGKALGYIQRWDKQADIQWVADQFKNKDSDELELLATVDMAACDLMATGTPVSMQSVKHLIATDAVWKEKLKKQTFSDANIARALRELNTLLQGGS